MKDNKQFKLIKKVLKDEGISFETRDGEFKFILPGDYVYNEMPCVVYKIAFKCGMRRCKNSFGFMNDAYRISCPVTRRTENDWHSTFYIWERP
jgi:hypothetical protein